MLFTDTTKLNAWNMAYVGLDLVIVGPNPEGFSSTLCYKQKSTLLEME